jgi:hypothetical protein
VELLRLVFTNIRLVLKLFVMAGPLTDQPVVEAILMKGFIVWALWRRGEGGQNILQKLPSALG